MAIEIREYLGATFTEHNDHPSFNPINLKESTHYSNRVAPNSLMVDIEGLHSIITRNDTFYTDKAMQESEKYWTQPYERPVIMHHNERDGVTIGRVKHAYWTDKNTRSGTGALRFITNIGTKEGIEGINNGSLSTVSVGLIAHEVRCSICNQDLAAEGECEHERGATYDGKRCYWIIHKFEPKELSFVIVPSDQYAHILKVYKPDKKDMAESTNKEEVNEMFGNPFMDLIEESKASIKDIDLTEGKVKDATIEEEDSNKNDKDNKKEEIKADEKETEAQETDKPESKEDSKEGESEETAETEQGDSKPESNEVEEKEESEESTEEESTEKQEITIEEDADKKTDSEEKDTKEIEEEVKKDIDSEKEDIYKDIERKLQDAEADKEEMQKEIANLKKELADTKAKLEVEKNLKESAEAELIQFRTDRKKSLVEKVNSLRAKASLEPEKVETLMEASEETLHFTIKNLTEFNSKINDLSLIPKTESNIAIEESKDNTQKISKKKDVKENKSASNIELEEAAVLDILSKAFSGGF